MISNIEYEFAKLIIYFHWKILQKEKKKKSKQIMETNERELMSTDFGEKNQDTVEHTKKHIRFVCSK